jgi:hypothetical protein
MLVQYRCLETFYLLNKEYSAILRMEVKGYVFFENADIIKEERRNQYDKN